MGLAPCKQYIEIIPWNKYGKQKNKALKEPCYYYIFYAF